MCVSSSPKQCEPHPAPLLAAAVVRQQVLHLCGVQAAGLCGRGQVRDVRVHLLHQHHRHHHHRGQRLHCVCQGTVRDRGSFHAILPHPCMWGVVAPMSLLVGGWVGAAACPISCVWACTGLVCAGLLCVFACMYTICSDSVLPRVLEQNTAWANDLYSGLVAPNYGADIWCETWQNGGSSLKCLVVYSLTFRVHLRLPVVPVCVGMAFSSSEKNVVCGVQAPVTWTTSARPSTRRTPSTSTPTRWLATP